MQYIPFHPIYNTESNALLIVLTNDPYGRGGLSLNAIRKAPHQHHAHDASPANPVISVCVIHSHVSHLLHGVSDVRGGVHAGHGAWKLRQGH